MNCNDKEWHKLIIQDLARLIELKFRDFKKNITKSNSSKSVHHHNRNNHQIKNYANQISQPNQTHFNSISSNSDKEVTIANSTISINTESDIFTRISEKIFELASEEPYGILGTRINIRLMLENGKYYGICQSFPYDSSTMATSEIVITLKEDVTSFKRFLQTFKLFTNIGKYFAMHIDSNNFEIMKTRLY